MSAFQASPGSPGSWRTLTLVVGVVAATLAACATSEIPQKPLPFSSQRPLEVSDFLLFEGSVRNPPLRDGTYTFEGVLEMGGYAPIGALYSSQGTAFQLKFRGVDNRGNPAIGATRKNHILALVIPRLYLPSFKIGSRLQVTYVHASSKPPEMAKIGVHIVDSDGTTLFLADVGGALDATLLPKGLGIKQSLTQAHITSFLTPSGCRVRTQHFFGSVTAGDEVWEVPPAEQRVVETSEGNFRVSILESFSVQGGLGCLEQPEKGFSYLLERL